MQPTRPFAPEEIARLLELVKVQGDVAVAAAAGLSRGAVTRAALGLPVHAGTRAALRAWVAGQVESQAA